MSRLQVQYSMYSGWMFGPIVPQAAGDLEMDAPRGNTLPPLEFRVLISAARFLDVTYADDDEKQLDLLFF